MKLRNAVLAFASIAAAALGAPAVASAGNPYSFVCHGYATSTPMYAGGPGVGPIFAYLPATHTFYGHQTVNVGGTFWSLGHTSWSHPNDYWVRTGDLIC